MESAANVTREGEAQCQQVAKFNGSNRSINWISLHTILQPPTQQQPHNNPINPAMIKSSTSTSSPPSKFPSVSSIHVLADSVINRIAAGEVIHKPFNALKELLENSIDAGSTKVSCILKEGGLKLLQISDNGHGIKLEDFPILCQRFTTSKIHNYEDLSSIQTFGFRGEALASITHIARVTIISQTASSVCSYRADYSDGELMTSPPKACAGLQGTTIIAQDLFYNNPVRLNALKNTAEEYSKCVDVIQKYALHYHKLNFSCKKFGSNKSDINTTSNVNQIDTIKLLYGNTVARELLPIQSKQKYCEINGFISNANYSMKKVQFILFINNRLVDCTAIRRSIELIYTEYLPKHTHPFVYFSLFLPAHTVDVNVHPTKREVNFINQSSIIKEIEDAVRKVLANANQSRTFYTQQLIINNPISSNNNSNNNAKVSNIDTANLSSQSSSAISGEEEEDLAETPIVKREAHSFDDRDEEIILDDSNANQTFLSSDRNSGDNNFAASNRSTSPRSELGFYHRKRQEINATSYQPTNFNAVSAGHRDFVDLEDNSATMDLTEESEILLEDSPVQHQEAQNIDSMLKSFERPAPRANASFAHRSSSVLDPIPRAQSNYRPQSMVRTDSTQAKLTAFMPLKAQTALGGDSNANIDLTQPESHQISQNNSLGGAKRARLQQIVCSPAVQLTSVHNLLRKYIDSSNSTLGELFSAAVWVGPVAWNLSAIQFQTKLYLINNVSLSFAYFYQLLMRNFANFPIISLVPSANLAKLLRLSLDWPNNKYYSESDSKKQVITQKLCSLLWEKAEMLEEYFSLQLKLAPNSQNSYKKSDLDLLSIELAGLPELLPGYSPALINLPLFLYQLANEIDYSSEETCFHQIITELANFYKVQSPEKYTHFGGNSSPEGNLIALSEQVQRLLYDLAFKSLKPFYVPIDYDKNGAIVQMTSLENLYKIFERC
jgi:DNA mismatch repair protein MLH1